MAEISVGSAVEGENMSGKNTGLFLCGLLGVVFLAPVCFLVTGSLMGQKEAQECLWPILQEGSEGYVQWKLLPQYPTLRFYVELLLDSPEFFVMFWNSVKIVLGILVGQLLLGVPAAWGFARYEFPGKRFLFTIYMLLMMLPFQVRMLSDYLLLDKLGLLDSLWGVILPAACSTFPVFLLYRFFCGIPEALLEAARLDGAGEISLLFLLGLPLGSPGIISVLVLDFLEYWNLIEQPLAFLKDQSLWPLALFLPEIGLDKAGIAFVASVVALLPAAFVFWTGQDYLEQGIVAAATKE